MKTYVEKNEGVITYHKILDFLKCQYLYYLKYEKKIVDEEEKDAFLFGSAFDQYITDKKEFERVYEIVARRGKEENGKIELTKGQGELIQSCNTELHRQPFFNGKRKKEIVRIEYKGHTLGAELDDYDKEEKLIRDTKTSSSIGREEKWLEQYKGQLAWYQFLIQVRDDILCDGILDIVTKENPPKSIFYKGTAKSLLDYRPVLLTHLDSFIEVQKSGLYASSDRSVCLECPAYDKCQFSIQKEFLYL